MAETDAQVWALRQELGEDPAATSRRQEATRRRAVEEHKARVAKALAQMPELEAKKKQDPKDKARASMTDPESRVMKWRPADFGRR